MAGSKWLIGFALYSATVVIAQSVVPADPCEEMPKDATAAKNFFTFDQFDRELRIAITKQDAIALAFLVNFPLRVNDAGATISIDNAAALKNAFPRRFHEQGAQGDSRRKARQPRV